MKPAPTPKSSQATCNGQMAAPKQKAATSDDIRMGSLHADGDALAANTAAIGSAKNATHMIAIQVPSTHKATSGWTPPPSAFSRRPS